MRAVRLGRTKKTTRVAPDKMKPLYKVVENTAREVAAWVCVPVLLRNACSSILRESVSLPEPRASHLHNEIITIPSTQGC